MQENFERGMFEGRVLEGLASIKDSLEDLKKEQGCLGKRIMALEIEHSRMKGMALGYGTVAGAFASFLMKYLMTYLK